jgi:hypothetical protein
LSEGAEFFVKIAMRRRFEAPADGNPHDLPGGRAAAGNGLFARDFMTSGVHTAKAMESVFPEADSAQENPQRNSLLMRFAADGAH